MAVSSLDLSNYTVWQAPVSRSALVNGMIHCGSSWLVQIEIDKGEILREKLMEDSLRKGATAMREALNKQQLISLVREVMQGEGDDQQFKEWGDLFDRSTPGPWGYIFDLIFYPHKHGLGNTPTAEGIVEKALGYKPIQL